MRISMGIYGDNGDRRGYLRIYIAEEEDIDMSGVRKAYAEAIECELSI